jgi:hypothetical protein
MIKAALTLIFLFLLAPLTWAGNGINFDLDHFKCYRVFGKTVDVVVNAQDQFSQEDMLVGRPVLLCNPADKNWEGINNPNQHLVCYATKSATDEPRGVVVDNQFGQRGLKVLQRENLLCVPSEKTCLGKGGVPVPCPNEPS